MTPLAEVRTSLVVCWYFSCQEKLNLSVWHLGEYPGVTVSNGAFLAAQLVKNLPALQETLVQFLGREDPLEKG